MSTSTLLKKQVKIAHREWVEAQERHSEAAADVVRAESYQLEKSEQFQRILQLYYREKYQVDSGDVIICDGEHFRFVEFAEHSTDPIVNRQLKAGRWATRKDRIHLYDWEKKTTMVRRS